MTDDSEAGNRARPVTPGGRGFEHNSEDAESLSLSGLQAFQAGRAAEAIPLLHAALQFDARNLDVLDALSAALLTERDYAQAEVVIRRALAVRGGTPVTSMKLGLTLAAQGKWTQAARAHEDAVAGDPAFAEAHHHLGRALMELHRPQEAIASFKRALALDAGNPHTHAALAAAFQQLGKPDEAMDHCLKALELDPDHALAHFNLGTVLLDRGELERGRHCFERAVTLQPDSAKAQAGLADVLHDRGRWEEAIDRYKRALALDPGSAEVQYNLAVTRLIRQEFGAAWPGFERRLDREGIHGQFRRDPASVGLYKTLARWRGPAEEGALEVAVWAEQGIGDQILFSTLIPELIAAGVRFTYEVDGRLIGAYQRAFPGQRFVPIADPPRRELQQADRVILSGSLPGWFRRDRGDFSRQSRAFLGALPQRVADAQRRVAAPGPSLKVALSWHSRRGGRLGLRKSVPLAEFAPLLRVPGAQFVDVQYGETKAEREAAQALTGTPLRHFEDVDAFNDLEGVLAILAACDLVITTSNVTAHLAGALGKRTWLLYPGDNPPFHYWAHAGSHRSLWYPSVEIITAQHYADWSSLIEHAAQRLELEAGHLGTGKAPAREASSADRLNEQARELRWAGKLDEARRSAVRAIDLDPQLPGAWFNLGAILEMQGKTEQGVEMYRKAIELNPQFAEAWSNLGGALAALGDAPGELDAYRRAAGANPDLAPVWSNLGSALLAIGEIQEAASAGRRAVELDPENAEAWSNLSNALLRKGDHENAAQAGARAVALSPGLAEAWSNYGAALMEQGDIAGSLAAHSRALEMRPDNAFVRYNQGLAQEREGGLEAAIHSYRQATGISPAFAAAHMRLACSLLTLGQFAEGWAEYEWRWREQGAPRKRYDAAPWNGERAPGRRLLVWGEQGVGDELIYAGMVGELAATGMRVTLETDLRLVTLMQRSLPDVAVVSRADSPRVAATYDWQVPLGSLGRWLRPSFGAFPAHGGYLKADPARTNNYASRLRAPGVTGVVGISWRSANRDIGAFKSHPLEAWAETLKTPGTRFVDLQYGDTRSERDALQRQHDVSLVHFDDVDLFDDIEGLAALCDACDLVVTVSNVTAHVAGALGKPVWLLVPAAKGRLWYWFHGRDDSPWYPSMRVFTQRTAGDWAEVLDRVRQALDTRARGGVNA